MEEMIISKTREIFSKAIKRFAKVDKMDELDISILLKLGEEEDRQVKYLICHNYVPNRELTIKEVLNVGRIEFGLPLSQLVPPQIKKIIENLETQMESKDIEVCVYLNKDDDEDVRYFVFNQGKLYKEVYLLDLIK
jgi:hypothetical protein